MSTATVQPKPATGIPVIPPAIQSQVIALRAAGKSKRKIAEQLGIHRNTVTNVIEHMQADVPDYSAIVHKLAGNALTRIEQVIPNDTDTSKWLLERTVFRPDVPEQYQVNGDVTLQSITTLLPSKPSPASSTSTDGQPSLPLSTGSTGTAGALPATAGDPSSREAPPNDIGLSNHTNFSQTGTNFSQFSTAQLEQELARRKAQPAQVLEAEVVGG